MADFILKAKQREVSTKGAVNQMRKNGFVPGVYYCKGQDPLNFSVSEVELKPFVFTSETHIIDLVIEGKETLKVLIKDVQFDPVTDRIIHIDVHGVTFGQVMHLQVPVQFTGNAPGVKAGGKLNAFMHKLDVECLPRHIPEHLEISISGLNIGDSIRVKDLEFENIKILNPEDAAVIGVSSAKGTVEDEVSTDMDDEIKEPEVIGKGKSEEESE